MSDNENLGRIALALSGGGARAIAFHLGCLRALHHVGILQQISTISSVSGGSVIAALYCSHRGDFDSFERRVKEVLAKGFLWSAVRTAITTSEGLNVLGLEWSQVDMARKVAWIHGDQAKAGKDIHVTLNVTALEVLQRQVGNHPDRVFAYRGRPIAQTCTKAWYGALKRAGIKDFRWHDLRHTWASWLAHQTLYVPSLNRLLS